MHEKALEAFEVRVLLSTRSPSQRVSKQESLKVGNFARVSLFHAKTDFVLLKIRQMLFQEGSAEYAVTLQNSAIALVSLALTHKAASHEHVDAYSCGGTSLKQHTICTRSCAD
jgi:hypothetical protein